ncbi:MAG: HEAT repeat domain-containing protein [Vicinamibacterales bacterium]
MLRDADARIRRRAALAIGRVGLVEGVAALSPLFADPEPEVRQVAAFAIGLIGDPRGRDPLVTALGDTSPVVKASAAEALGLIGDPGAADAVARMASELIANGVLTPVPGDEDDARRDTPSAAVRLAIVALTRMRAFTPLTSVVLDASGQPRALWWPIAFALQRFDDARAKPALLALVKDAHPYTRAFALRGLGGMKDPALVPVLAPFASGPDRTSAIEAVRSLGRLGAPEAAPALLEVLRGPKTDPTVRLEAVMAAAIVSTPALDEALLDVLGDPSPSIRAAALRALSTRDQLTFLTVLSGLDTDQNWSVRAALASVLGTLPAEAGLPRLRALLEDPDQRVLPAVLTSLVKLRPPDTGSVLLAKLKSDDPVVRAAAARGLAEFARAPGGDAGEGASIADALAEAYRAGKRDTTYLARAAALAALVEMKAPQAQPVLTEALGDQDWAVRVRAVQLLKGLEPAIDWAARARPAPTGRDAAFYDVTRLVAPPVSTQFYIDTDRGSIQCELAVLDAPLTVESFVALARRGFYDGLSFHRVVPNYVVQAGDPRGDSEGGPGFTIRDELNQRPYLRGTLGMALDWADTGGSQFFITHLPQPLLDAKYTVFGRVLSGMELVDQIQPGEVIRRIRIWDGTSPP